MSKPFVPEPGAAIVRYQVADLERSLAFYAGALGFEEARRAGPVWTITRGALHLLLSGPGSSGSRPMPDGAPQAPGGWNRVVLYVDDLEDSIAKLTRAHAHFRNRIESGPGGRQILVDDPDGNPIELHEAPR
ncbi:MAG TPA: VOC family protein [Kofleriaceae bacterium]|nr:VOC family protein [Kofleriaceae bacterium]